MPSPRYDHPIDISSWVPERPYWSSPTLLRDMEGYYAKLDALEEELAKYDAMLIVGGSGPIVDIANNGRVHALILSFLKLDKPIGAECYGVTALAFARDLTDRRSIISGKRVTGHCKEYDYKDGTGFIGCTCSTWARRRTRSSTSCATPSGPRAPTSGTWATTSVIVDYPFITGRSTPTPTLRARRWSRFWRTG